VCQNSITGWCKLRDQLLRIEISFRQQARRRAGSSSEAHLYNEALKTQRQRHQHEGQCAYCLAAEAVAEAA
jgi:hypothetical protein